MESIGSISKRLQSPRLSFEPQGEYECEPCRDTGWVYVIDEQGQNRGVKKCQCLLERIQRAAVSRIPPRYRLLRLESLRPQTSLHFKQASVIEDIKGNPGASYLLFGKQGTGKSLLGWLLYRVAAEAGRPVVGLSVSDLLFQFRRFEVDRIEPIVDAESLHDPYRRWLIFLDECEKARPSEFAGEKLFALLDAAYNYGHQVVITSNLQPNALKLHWSRASEQYGPSIMRRLLELPDAVHVEMF